MYGYKAIPQRLPVNGLLCRAEKDMKTEKQKMERAGGVNDRRYLWSLISLTNIKAGTQYVRAIQMKCWRKGPPYGVMGQQQSSMPLHLPQTLCRKKDATLSAQTLQRSDSSQSRQQATPHHTHTPQTHIQSTHFHADSILRHVNITLSAVVLSAVTL